jgi:hypothetical protein
MAVVGDTLRAVRPVPPPRPARAAPGSVFVPALLLSVALVAWLGFQTAQQVMERRQLTALETALQPQAQAATQLRGSLDALATATARLAADGNVLARSLVDELRRRGITINPPRAAAPP